MLRPVDVSVYIDAIDEIAFLNPTRQVALAKLKASGPSLWMSPTLSLSFHFYPLLQVEEGGEGFAGILVVDDGARFAH